MGSRLPISTARAAIRTQSGSETEDEKPPSLVESDGTQSGSEIDDEKPPSLVGSDGTGFSHASSFIELKRDQVRGPALALVGLPSALSTWSGVREGKCTVSPISVIMHTTILTPPLLLAGI